MIPNQTGPTSILKPVPQHWSTTRMSVEPAALFHLHIGLHPHSHSFRNTVIPFADDTTVVGKISGNDESAYRDEVSSLTGCCKDSNLTQNVRKTRKSLSSEGMSPHPVP